MDRAGRVRWLQRHFVNPLSRRLVMAGLSPWTAILETTGRISGQPRQTPVGNGLASDGRTFWVVTEFGHAANYVRNIQANPRVRVRVGRRWRTGTAVLMPHDDTRARQRSMRRLNAAVVRAVGTELMTVRIDLDR
jgi:deazaflavin-dependent oxidoreductase (nitroreductase family)